MPIHDFQCLACGERFEELVRADATPPCPSCGGDTRRLLSQVAPPPRLGLRGGEARRAEAARRDRRERKRGDA